MQTHKSFRNIEPVILASESPRRKKFLRQLGMKFTIFPAAVDETPYYGEQAADFAQRMAVAKATVAAEQNPSSWVIGADTVVTLNGGEILGKPDNPAQALIILKQLRGKTHQVVTGLCLCCLDKNINSLLVEITDVTFMDVSDDVLLSYIKTGEPLDKAGAYGIQGIGAFLVKSINGSCSNVIGMPLSQLVSLLIDNDIIMPA